MDSKMRKSRSLLALSTIENAALETAALHTCSVCDRMAECLGQETGDSSQNVRSIAQREYGPWCQRTEHHNEFKDSVFG